MLRTEPAASDVERPASISHPPRRKLITTPISSISPVIRIAHRIPYRLNVAPRIIFDHEIVFIARGEGWYETALRSYAYRSNDILFITPFTPHKIVQVENGANEHIAIHFDFAPNLPHRSDVPADRTPYSVRIAGFAGLPEEPVRASEQLTAQIIKVLNEFNKDDPFAQLCASAVLTEALVDIMRSSFAPKVNQSLSLSQARVQKVTEEISRRFHESITLQELADLAGLSASRLNALFREYAGASPIDFVQRARISEARKLLGDINLSIKQVAAKVGFEDALHFSKVFRRIDGLSPSQYRQQLLASDGE